VTIRQIVRVEEPTRMIVVFDDGVSQREANETGANLRRRFPDIEFTLMIGATLLDIGPVSADKPREPRAL
jgi:hypothetical protein